MITNMEKNVKLTENKVTENYVIFKRMENLFIHYVWPL